MKIYKKALVSVLIPALMCALFSACGNSSLSVTVTNCLDYDIADLYIDPDGEENWETSLLGDNGFTDSDSIQVSLEPTDNLLYDMKVSGADGDCYYFYELPLSNGTTVELVSDQDEYKALVTPKKGDAVTICGDHDYVVKAPTPEDLLDASISMPGYESLVIPYPSTMKVAKSNSENRFIQFDAVNDPDSNNGISFNLIELQGSYDNRLSSSSTAQSALVEIVGKVCEQTFPGMLISNIDTKFFDGGTYYSAMSYLWMSGEVFEETSNTPVRGVLECRYYGHTGYVLAAFTLADEGAIQNYFGIASNMFKAISFGDSWTTPDDTNSSSTWSDPGDYTDWSDPGDYGTDYTDWSDSGDYGTDYTDWSDPGDYGTDYTDWSDPGDYGTDYADWSDPGDN